jgi:hypothetical protein
MGQLWVVGLAILVVAIAANALATMAGLSTWYGFFGAIQDHGLVAALRKERLISLLFLFLLYPFALGLAGYAFARWLG